MKCSNCGKEVPERAIVCGYCGTEVVKPKVEKPKVKQASKTTKPPAKDKPLKKSKAQAKAEKPKPAMAKKVHAEKVSKEDIPSQAKKFPIWVWGVIAVAVLLAVLLIPKLAADTEDSLARLEGVWTGTIEDSMNDFTFDLAFVFPDDCEFEEYCGYISVPDWDWESEVMIVNVSGIDYEIFVLSNEELSGEDLPAEFLTYNNAGQLDFYSERYDWKRQGSLFKE